MSEPRGEYRPIYNALWDDPAFLALGPKVRLTLLAVKAALPNWGIALNRAWGANLAHMTGLKPSEVDACLSTLEEAKWIVREGTVLWLRNGLRFEPTSNHRDPKHRKALHTHLAGLPRLAIVEAFRDHYPRWLEPADTTGHGRPPAPQKKGPEKAPKKGSKKDSKKGSEKGRGEGRGGEGIEVGVAEIPTTPTLKAEGALASTPSKNWVTRLAEVYQERTKGILANVAKVGADLKPLVELHGEGPVLAAWDAACRKCMAQGKLQRLRFFAQDYGEWENEASFRVFEDDGVTYTAAAVAAMGPASA